MFSEYPDEEGYRLLPRAVEDAVRRFLGRGLGLAIIFFVALSWLSLVSWSVTDPSLTHVTREPARNLLGYPGAAVSDLMLQTLGLASAILLLAPMFWGLDLLYSGRISSARWKILSHAASVLVVAGAFSCVPKIVAWPLNHGYGGIVGDGIAAVAVWAAAHASADFAQLLAFVALITAGGVLIFASLGITVATVRRATRRFFDKAAKSAEGAAKKKSRARYRHQNRRPKQPAAATLQPFIGGSRHWTEPTLPETPRPGPAEAGSPPQGQSVELRLDPEALHQRPVNQPEFVRAFEDDDLDWDGRGEDFDSDTDEGSVTIARRFAPQSGNRRHDVGIKEVLRNAARNAAVVPDEVTDDTAEPYDGDVATQLHDEPDSQDLPAGITSPEVANDQEPMGEDMFLAPEGDETQIVWADEQAPVEPPSPPAAADIRRWTAARTPVGYRRPSLNLLTGAPAARPGPEMTQTVQRGTARLLEDVLSNFGVKGEITEVRPGPVVTAYHVALDRSINPRRVVGLANDIARAMNVASVRAAVLSAGRAIAIEVPNVHRHQAALRDILSSQAFRSFSGSLSVALGLAAGGQPVVADLGALSNVLVAGQAKSGKSTCLKSILLSLTYRNGPDDCRFVLFDPKLLEFGCFNGIPHLACPVLSETEEAFAALEWIVAEMDERAKRMAKLSARSLEIFNNRVRNARKRGEMIARTVRTGFCDRTGQPIYEHEQMEFEPMPHIVVAIDELSELMGAAGPRCEEAILRIAEKGKGVGVHLVAATKTTTELCLTERLRAGFKSVIAFKLGSKVDSRRIVGEEGAEQLLDWGDCILSSGQGRSTRVHTAQVSQEEASAVGQSLSAGGEPRYIPSLMSMLMEASEPFPIAMAADAGLPPAAE